MRKFLNNIEIHMQSFLRFRIYDLNYRSSLMPIVKETSSHILKLNVHRTLRDELYNLTRPLEFINYKIRAWVNCIAPQANTSKSQKYFKDYRYRERKGWFHDNIKPNCSSVFYVSHYPKQILCEFCKKNHWSDECQAIHYCLQKFSREFK